ncbi:MAG: ABC transporter substrate-binding protein [Gammaproteobacteria bacterium]|nr:ABC transporter substrate-binding protein [Gammaproteobacteria bacterium]
MSRLQLSVAMGDYDRTRAIADGRVKVDGVEAVCMLLSPEEMFFRAFRHQEFDVSELSLASYCVTVARGDPHYIGVPVFLSRAFRHTSVYIRLDRGIDKPTDLKGKRIGIAEYQQSANVWIRGILESDYGVKPSDIIWVQGGMDAPGRPEKLKLDLPKDVVVEPSPEGKTLNDMLAAGEIDGFIGPRWPRCFNDGHPQVGRLFNDSILVASDYYARTGIFPIMHLLGVRRTLADEHPWLPGALLKAFTEAKRLATDALNDTSATKVTMPFVEDNLAIARRLMGSDYWPYGVAANREVLDTFCEMHHRQGLSARRLSVDELFHPSTYEAYSL